MFVFGDLNYRIDPGAVVHREWGWGAMWKRSNDAPPGSIAAVAGLAAKSAKKKAVASAFPATSPSGKGGGRRGRRGRRFDSGNVRRTGNIRGSSGVSTGSSAISSGRGAFIFYFSHGQSV